MPRSMMSSPARRAAIRPPHRHPATAADQGRRVPRFLDKGTVTATPEHGQEEESPRRPRKNRSKPPRQQRLDAAASRSTATPTRRPRTTSASAPRATCPAGAPSSRTRPRRRGRHEAAEMPAVDAGACLPGRVLRVHGLASVVETDDGRQFRCAVRRLLKTLATDERSVVTTGDRVWFRPSLERRGLIERVEPRHGMLDARVPRPRARPGRQRRSGRHRHVAGRAGPQAAPDRPLPRQRRAGRHRADRLPEQGRPGRPGRLPAARRPATASSACRRSLTSAATGLGIDRLRELLRGRQTVFSGQSGVGKSSLLNAIQPGLGLQVREVSEVNQKGRHTTTTAAADPAGLRRLGRGHAGHPPVRSCGTSSRRRSRASSPSSGRSCRCAPSPTARTRTRTAAPSSGRSAGASSAPAATQLPGHVPRRRRRGSACQCTVRTRCIDMHPPQIDGTDRTKRTRLMRFDLHLHTSRHSPDSVMDPLQPAPAGPRHRPGRPGHHRARLALDRRRAGRAAGRRARTWSSWPASRCRPARGTSWSTASATRSRPRGIGVADLCREVHRQGGVVVAAHPFRWDQPFDGILAGEPELDGLELMTSNMDADCRRRAAGWRRQGWPASAPATPTARTLLGGCYTEFAETSGRTPTWSRAIRNRRATARDRLADGYSLGGEPGALSNRGIPSSGRSRSRLASLASTSPGRPHCGRL